MSTTQEHPASGERSVRYGAAAAGPAGRAPPRRTTREIRSHCPDCGRELIRPVDFSAERLLYLHRKWVPACRDLTAAGS